MLSRLPMLSRGLGLLTHLGIGVLLAQSARAETVFLAPDSGSDRVDYACSFHWFRTNEGASSRIIGMDLIRSDDQGRRGLRVFEILPDGSIHAWVHESPSNEWEAFATDQKPDLSSPMPVIGRGRNWVAGAVGGVLFDLDVVPQTGALGSGRAGLGFLKMNSQDFRRVRTSGWIQLDGEKIAVDAVGPLSIHYGDSLPEYAYFATVPNGAGDALPQLLMSTIGADDFRGEPAWLNGIFFTYSYGSNGAPGFLFHVGSFNGTDVKLGLRSHVELSDIHRFDHFLLGKPTVTAAAHAILTMPDPESWYRDKKVDLGWIVLDYRGERFASTLWEK